MDHSEMPRRTLGRTGERVSMIGLGGWHLALKHVDAKLADRIMRSAADRGINFFDNCWDYNDGESEKRMGRMLKDGYRERVFLMTKIDGRTKKEAMKQLEESLKRLQVDYIDLVQHHEILRFEDANRVFAEDGAHDLLVDQVVLGRDRPGEHLEQRHLPDERVGDGAEDVDERIAGRIGRDLHLGLPHRHGPEPVRG